MRTRVRKNLASLGKLAAASVVALGVLIGAGYLWLRSDSGQRAVNDTVNGLVDDRVPGRFQIDGLVVNGSHLTADRLRVWSPEGRPTLDLRDIEMDVEVWRSLSERGLYSTASRVGRGEVWVVEPESGPTFIERAFSDAAAAQGRGEEPSSGGGSGGGFTMDLEELEFANLTVRVDAGGAGARFGGTQGRGHIWLDQGEDIQLRFWSVSTDIEADMSFVPDTRTEGLAITIDPTMESFVHFAGDARMLDQDVTLAGHAPRRGGSGMRICVWTGGDPIASLLGIAGEIGTGLSSVSLDMRPSDAPSRPRCEEEGEERSADEA